jgi:hypothetical protein
VGGSGGSSNDPSADASSPGEEVTSLPVVDATAGLTLVGRLRELRAVVTSVRGAGRIHVQPLGDRRLAVTFIGDYRVGLDRSTLANTGLAVSFRGGAPFQGGFAYLQIGSSLPVLVPAERVALPVARLASTPRALGKLIQLDAFGLRAQRAHLEAEFARQEVVLYQRSTL